MACTQRLQGAAVPGRWPPPPVRCRPDPEAGRFLCGRRRVRSAGGVQRRRHAEAREDGAHAMPEFRGRGQSADDHGEVVAIDHASPHGDGGSGV